MKKLVSLILALVLCLSVSVSAFALVTDVPEDEAITAAAGIPGDSPNAEETEWVTRVTDDGLIQIRLWSITYGYWKTDWITVGNTV